jgi:cyanophycin synthetase
MLDYGHNADAFGAVGQLRRASSAHRLIGVVAVPGDRADDLIRGAGRVAAEVFDEIFIREDDDLRGRRPGEIAKMMCETIHELRPGIRCEFVVDGEVAALYRALEHMQPGDLVVVFYDQLEPLQRALGDLKAEQVPPLTFAEHWSRPNRSQTNDVVHEVH